MRKRRKKTTQSINQSKEFINRKENVPTFDVFYFTPQGQTIFSDKDTAATVV